MMVMFWIYWHLPRGELVKIWGKVELQKKFIVSLYKSVCLEFITLFKGIARFTLKNVEIKIKLNDIAVLTATHFLIRSEKLCSIII